MSSARGGGVKVSDAVAADQPFYLYMAHYAVHAPFQAKEEITRRYLNN